MPSKNNKQLNFFLLVKAYKEYGEIGVKRQYKQLVGYKPKLTPEYMMGLAKTAGNITNADLADKTSGIEGDSPLGDKRDIKVGYWALFRGKYKPSNSMNEAPKEGEFIALITRVDNNKGIANFSPHGFRNKYGQTMSIPRRAVVSHPEFMNLDYALFDNIISTAKTPQELAKSRESIMEKEIRNKIIGIIKEGFDDMKFSDDNLMPESLIDTFYNRIQRLINDGATKNHPSIKRELDRIESINGKIPKKIQSLLDTLDIEPDLSALKNEFNSLDETAQWKWILNNKDKIASIGIDEDTAYAILQGDNKKENILLIKRGGYYSAVLILKALGFNTDSF